jgi:TP901 family phage tail tape measure protein
MLDFSRLGMTVDTSQVRSARGDVKGFANETKRASGEVETATGKMQKSFGLVKTAVGLTLAAVVALAGSVGTLVRFERSIAQVGAISRASASDLAAMRDIATELGSTTEFSASQAAGGLRFLAQAGFSARESVAALPAVLDLATAAQLGLAESADIASNIMSGFGIAATDTAAVTDILAAAASRANTDVSQLGQAMKFVAPVASGLGISMNDTAAAIGKLSDAGIQGGQAGTSLRKIMLSLAAPTEGARDAIQGLGLAVSAVDPNMVSLTEIVDRFRDANLDAASGAAIFGQEAVSAMLALTSQADGLRQLTGDLKNVDGAAADMAASMRDDLRGDVDGLKSALEGLVIALGDAGLTAALRSIVKGITAFVSVISGGISFISKFTSELVTVGTTTDQMNAAIFSVNGQIAGELALMSELFGELPAGTRLTRETAQAKLDQASAIRARILQGQAELEQIAKESQAYKQLENHMAAVQQLILDAELDRATNAGTLVAPSISDAALQALREELTQTQAEMTKLVITAGQLPPEYHAATARMEQLQAALDAAGDGMVVIKDETERAASVGEKLRALLATLPGYTQQAGDGANYLTRALGGAANAALSVFGAVRSVIALLAPLGAGLTRLSTVASTAVKVSGAVGNLFGTVINSDGMKAGIKHLKDAASNLTLMAGNAVKAEVATAELNKSLGGGGGGGTAEAADKAKTATEAFNDVMKEATYTAEEFGSELGNSTVSAVRSVADAWGDFVVSGFRDFQGFKDAILQSLGNMISKMISMAAQNKILFSMGFGGQASGGGLIQQAGNILGGGSGGSGAGGLLGNLVSGVSTFVSGIGTGLQSALGLGGFASNGIFSVAANAAQAVATGVGSFAASIGAALPVIGLAVAAFSFFKKSVKELDAGIRVTATGVDALVESFRTTETKRFWGLSKKVATNYEDAEAEVADPIQKSVDQIGESIKGLANVLNLEADNIDKASYQFSISTKGKSESEIAEAIQEELTNLSDAFTNAIVGTYEEVIEDTSEMQALKQQLEDLQKRGAGGGKGADMRFADELRALQATIDNTETATTVIRLNEAFEGLVREGEGSYNTLLALAGSLELVNGTFAELGYALFDASLAGANAARVFADAFGGWDAFSEKMSFFVDTFYSDAEKLDLVTERVSQALAGLDPAFAAVVTRNRDTFKELTDMLGANAATDPEAAVDFAALINAAPLIDQMFTLQDAIANAGNAVDGATGQIDQFNSVASEREQLERRLLQLQGDTAALRVLELEQVHESNRAILEQIHNLEDQQEAQRAADEAAAQAARDAETLASKRANMEAEILRLEGDTVALRQIELDALDSSLVPLQQRIYQLQDEAEATAEAKRLADELAQQQEATARERSTLEAELLRLQGDTAALRALELAALDPTNRELQQRIWNLEDEQVATAAANAAIEAAANERIGLETRLLQLQGDTAALRERELAELDPSNRALLQRIFALEDLQDAEAEQARIDQEAATAAQAIADQREQMTKQLLVLEGDVVGVRTMELAALDPSLRALQQRIWGLEDEAEASEAARAAAEKAAGERESLETRALELQGNTVALRARELEALEPANRALQEYVWGLEAANEAMEEANRLAEEQAAEKYGLHTRLLELLGDTDQLRARELALLFPANRALQERIWALEDAQQAEEDAATALADRANRMRDALSLVVDLIGSAISDIRERTDTEVEILRARLAAAQSSFDLTRATLDATYRTVEASVDAERVVAVARYENAIASLDRRMGAAQDTVGRLGGVFSMLDAAYGARTAPTDAILRGQVRGAQDFLIGQGGALPGDQAQLQTALDRAAQDSTRFYADAQSFKSAQLRTNAAIAAMRNNAEGQLTEAEQTLASLETIRTSREAQHEAQMDRLDAQLARAKAIYDEALGNTVAVREVDASIQGLQTIANSFVLEQLELQSLTDETNVKIESLENAATAQIDALQAQLTEAQRQVQIAEGTYQATLGIEGAIADLADAISEYMASGSGDAPAYAAGGTHRGGPARLAEHGIEMVAPSHIFNPSETRAMLDNRAVVYEIQQLRSEVRQLRQDNNSRLDEQVLAANKANKTTAKWDKDGLPPERS